MASPKGRAWTAVRSTLQHYPAVSRPLWKAYYQVYPREIHGMRDGELNNREIVFGEIFEKNEWASDESRSGKGSGLETTVEVRRQIPRILSSYSVSTFLDAPCGDYNWMRRVQMPAGTSYVGADIVAPLIASLNGRYSDETHRFQTLDIVKGDLPEADLWLCRHALFHLPIDDIKTTLQRFRRSKIKYLLTTTHNFCRKNLDVNPGGFRFINLRKPPFNLPKPMLQFDDFDQLGPPCMLAMWSREQIPEA
jgi:hypothetical protein